MTASTEEAPADEIANQGGVREVLNMPADLYDEANALICEMAEVAGDPEAVYDCARRYCTPKGRAEDAFTGVLAALLVTFAECITLPTPAGEISEVSLPTT